MKPQPKSEHPHGLSDADYDSLFTTDKHVVFGFHGYPWLVHRLTYRRTNHKMHVRGYEEEGPITTPFDMRVQNDLDRFHLVQDVVDRLPHLGGPGADRDVAIEGLAQPGAYAVGSRELPLAGGPCSILTSTYMTTSRRSAPHVKQGQRASVRSQALARLRTLIGALNHSARAVERSVGITNAQLFLLQQLSAEEPLSVNDLAVRARTQQSTVSIVVARLVRTGLVAKRRSPADGRLAVVSLTPRGRRLLRRAPAPPTSVLLQALEKLSDRDARALASGLRALVTALDLAPDEPAMLFEHVPRRRSSPTGRARAEAARRRESLSE